MQPIFFQKFHFAFIFHFPSGTQESTGIPAEFSLKFRFRFRPDFLFWPEFQAGILIKIVSNNWCKMFVKTQ